MYILVDSLPNFLYTTSMVEDFNKNFKTDAIRKKINASSRDSFASIKTQWQAVASSERMSELTKDIFLAAESEIVAKKTTPIINVPNGKDFSKQDLSESSFSVQNLEGANFAGATLRGVDFSGANLAKASFAGADLSYSIFAGTILREANFTGAILNGVKLTEADIQDAILLDIEIDAMGIEELQALVEYLAKYYPHKLNLGSMNLTLLNLANIDLTKINLKGVDFTGCDMTGVNIMELDLSECIISPEQIAQALGRVPDAEELKRLLAPKTKKKQYDGKIADGIMEWFLGNGKQFGVWDVTKDKGVKIEDLMKMGKKVFQKIAGKPEPKLEEIQEHVVAKLEEKEKTHNDELKKIIEERKKQELEARKEKQQIPEVEKKPIDNDLLAERMRSIKGYSRE